MIKSIEYFRAIAIILIVAGHLLLAGIESSYLFELAIQNIFLEALLYLFLFQGFCFIMFFLKVLTIKGF